MAGRIKTYVYADDEVTEQGLHALLRVSPAVEVIGDDAIDAARVAVVAAAAIDDQVLALARGIQRDGVPAVLLVVDDLDPDDLAAMGSAGITGVLRRREITGTRLVDVVRRISDGLAVVPDDVVGHLLRSIGTDRGGRPAGPALSERERDVLRHLADGLSTAEIGEELAYSERTVKGVVHDITTRLQLRNRSHAVAVALRSGWI